MTSNVTVTRRRRTAPLRNEAAVRRQPSAPSSSYLRFVIMAMTAKATRASFYMSVRGRGARWHGGRTDKLFMAVRSSFPVTLRAGRDGFRRWSLFLCTLRRRQEKTKTFVKYYKMENIFHLISPPPDKYCFLEKRSTLIIGSLITNMMMIMRSSNCRF
jgi:hypothetical protein